MLNPLWLLFSIVVWLKKTTSLPKLNLSIVAKLSNLSILLKRLCDSHEDRHPQVEESCSTKMLEACKAGLEEKCNFGNIAEL